MYEMKELLKRMIELDASDLHICAGTPPAYRIHGKLERLDPTPLSPRDTHDLVKSIMTERQYNQFKKELELDFSIGVESASRYRVNAYLDRGSVAAAFRTIPFKIRTFEELNLPPIIAKLSDKPRGLVLVTGPTGSGKSTTLAAMIDAINSKKKTHIITMEDPIEYLHKHKVAVVNQREVHADTHSFAAALKSILRQDPDIVLLGEMRDPETIEAALTVSETGHLTFATLHTNSAVQTINRIIEVFPAHQQAQIRTQLSFVLEGVISQQLLPTKDGAGRALAMEVMTTTPAIRNLIRDDKVHQIYSSMTSGQGASGMITMSQSLIDLAKRNVISHEMAVTMATVPEEVEKVLYGK